MHSDPQARRSPWLAVGGMCGVYFSFGLTIGVMGPLVDEISTELELSRSTMGSILGAWALIYIFTSVPAGTVVDRLGLRWSLALGSLSIAATLFLRSLAGGPISLFAAVAVFGIGGPLVSIASPKLIASLFEEDHRRFPTGLTVAAPTLGTAIALAITNPVLLPLFDGRWRPVVVLIGVVSLVAGAGWLYASRAVAHLPQDNARPGLSTVGRLLKLQPMRLILLISVCSFFLSHSLTAWLPEILADSGQSDNAAGYLAAISVTVGIVGALTIARLTPNNRRATTLVAIFLVIGTMVTSLTLVPVGLVVIALGVLGFARAGVIPMLFLEIMGDDDIGLADIGAATGLFFAIAQLGGFSGPYAVGFVADRTDGFTAATVLLALVALAAAVLALMLRSSRSLQSASGTTDLY